MVSVIVPTHQRQDMLAAALASVQSQTRTDFECCIVNDCPEDVADVDGVVARLTDPRFHALHNDRNLGGNVCRNRGIQESTGDIIAFLDDDDAWEPTYLEKQVEALVANPEAVLVYSGVFIEEGAGEHTGKPCEAAPLPDNVVEAMRQARFCPVTSSCVVVRREAVLRVGGFDEDLQSLQDWDMWFRLARTGLFCRTGEPLVRHRLHEGPRTSTAKSKRLKALRQLERKWQGEYDLHSLARIIQLRLEFAQALAYASSNQRLRAVGTLMGTLLRLRNRKETVHWLKAAIRCLSRQQKN